MTKEELENKNIEWAADRVAECVFYHNNDSSEKERLKIALKIFAYIILGRGNYLPDNEKTINNV